MRAASLLDHIKQLLHGVYAHLLIDAVGVALRRTFRRDERLGNPARRTPRGQVDEHFGFAW